MAKRTSVNLLPANGSIAMFQLKEFLKNDLGFVILESGDGSAIYSGTPAFSSETLTGTANFADAETVTIDGKVYTFQSSLTDVDGNVQVGGSLAASLQNLHDAINLEGTPGTQYATSMTVHPSVRARSLTATTLDAVAYQPGGDGDNILVSETGANASWGAANLSGGGGGDEIDDGNTGANGFGNNDAWVRAGSPEMAADAVVLNNVNSYEWLFQRNTSNQSWEIVYSASDQFVGGAPSATARPTATDEQVLINANALPTDGGYRWHLIGYDVGEGSPVPIYPWYAIGVTYSIGMQPDALIMHEAMAPGSYPALVGTRSSPTTGDPDPSIVVAKLNTGSFNHDDGSNQLTSTSGTSPLRGWFAMNGTNGNTESFTWFNAFYYLQNSGFGRTLAPFRTAGGGGGGPNPVSGQEALMPVLVGRVVRLGSQVGSKGFMSHIRYGSVPGEYPATRDVNGERYVKMGDLYFPFENGALPL